MNFLLDTNMISEPKQKQPNPKVLEWLDAPDETKLYLSVLTVSEIKKGIARLDSSRRKVELENWLEALRAHFSNRILPITEKTFLYGAKCAAISSALAFCVRRLIPYLKRRRSNTI